MISDHPARGNPEPAGSIPTIDTTDAARAILGELAGRHEWVSVLWDRGWGDSGETAQISVIVDGDGQRPMAWLTPEVYRELVADATVAANSLKTFKARRVHDFKAPPEPELTVSSGDVAETVVRDLLAEAPDAPLLAEFYRGLDPDSPMPRTLRDTVASDACSSGWFVRILPGDVDAAISAAGAPDLFGPNLIGAVESLSYPRAADGEVDTSALLGEGFRAQLRTVVAGRLAVLNTERVARGLAPLGGL